MNISVFVIVVFKYKKDSVASVDGRKQSSCANEEKTSDSLMV